MQGEVDRRGLRQGEARQSDRPEHQQLDRLEEFLADLDRLFKNTCHAAMVSRRAFVEAIQYRMDNSFHMTMAVNVWNDRGLSRRAGVRFRPHRHGVGTAFSPEPGDTVIAAPGVDVFIAPELAPKLEGSTIDVADQGGKTDLVLRPPRIGAALPELAR